MAKDNSPTPDNAAKAPSNAEKFEQLFARIEQVEQANTTVLAENATLKQENAALKASMVQTENAQGMTLEKFQEGTRKDKLAILEANKMVPADEEGTMAIQKREGTYLWSYIFTPKQNRRKDAAKRVNYNVTYPIRCEISEGKSEVEKLRNEKKVRDLIRDAIGEYSGVTPTDLTVAFHGRVDEIPHAYIIANNNCTVYSGPTISIGAKPVPVVAASSTV